MFAVPWPTALNSDAGKPVIWETTAAVVSWLGALGGTGVVYQRTTKNAATTSAIPTTTAAGVTHTGVLDTGLRIGRRAGTVFLALIRPP